MRGRFARGKGGFAGVVHADITERLGQGQRLSDEGPRSLQIHGILAAGPGNQERIGQPLRASAPTQDWSRHKRIGIDTSKAVFTLHGVDQRERPILSWW